MRYDATATGFVLHVDLTVYARPAVFKAFYHLQKKYIISYERHDSILDVYFDRTETDQQSLLEEIRDVYNELTFEMLRYDTLQETTHIRELLVGRALYASCVELDREVDKPTDNLGQELDSWKEDSARIFESWTGQ